MNQKLPTPDEQRRLLLAVFLSMLVVLGYFLYAVPKNKEYQREAVARELALRTERLKEITSAGVSAAKEPKYPAGMKFITENEAPEKSKTRLYDFRQYPFVNSCISGTVSHDGSKILSADLKKYKEEQGKDAPVTLLNSTDADKSYTIETGWLPSHSGMEMPNAASYWKTQAFENGKIVPGKKVRFSWSNNQGQEFIRFVEIDDCYMMKITDTVLNKSDREIVIYPYSKITRVKKSDSAASAASVVHEGPVGYIGGKLYDPTYEDVLEDGKISVEAATGWIGITDKYWLTAIIPEAKEDKIFRFNAVSLDKDKALYQADVRGGKAIIPSGKGHSITNNYFIGAKELTALKNYEENLKVEHLDLAVDFGWYYFMTKPLSIFLHRVGGWLHSHGVDIAFGIALLLITVFVRLLTYPLANKSFRSMNAMKKLQPQMKEIKEKYGSNPQEMQKKFLELYQTEQVTPFSGCWPMFIQIPIFFALYKTLYISLDMRQAPFWGWIHDLSIPDPTSVLNLFGLIPIDLPSALVIGVWPLLYGITMYMQQRLSPAPMDKTQAMMMDWMPWIFCYMFSQLPAGMVIYFVWSNILGIAQQYYLQHKMGLEPSLFRRKTSEEYDAKVMSGDNILHSERKKKKNVKDAVVVKDKK